MEAIGELAGGVAHDFNNVITVIQNTVELLQSCRPTHPKMEEDLEVIRRSCHGASNLTRALLAFARRQVLEPEDVGLDELVVNLTPTLSRLLPGNIWLEYLPADTPGTVRADRSQLEQVIVNLCVNARDAMPDGGSIAIEVGNRLIDEAYRREHPWARPGRYVAVSVADTGMGMDEEARRRAFEPFFTTKGSQGTGLGLASAYGIVKQHDGMIEIRSSPMGGTIVEVMLPEVEPEPRKKAPVIIAPVVGGNETILVVDDHPDLLSVLARALERYGYRTLEARDGSEALELLRSEDLPPDLVITDVTMPEVGGPELCQRGRELIPDLPFIFVSGVPIDPATQPSSTIERAGFLDKPFEIKTLTRKVREILREYPRPRGG